MEQWRVLSFILLLLLLASLFIFPVYSRALSITLLSLSIGTAVILTVQRQWSLYREGQSGLGGFIRATGLDLLCLALTMGAAIFAGRLAGSYVGTRFGLWLGLLAGFAGGFGAAIAVRFAWGRLVRVEIT